MLQLVIYLYNIHRLQSSRVTRFRDFSSAKSSHPLWRHASIISILFYFIFSSNFRKIVLTAALVIQMIATQQTKLPSKFNWKIVFFKFVCMSRTDTLTWSMQTTMQVSYHFPEPRTGLGSLYKPSEMFQHTAGHNY